ncbi:MAG: YfcE family phosphodiesterase [Clostridia bacterium]
MSTKRIIACSDSHGFESRLRSALNLAQQRGKIDTFVFLGDGISDFEAIKLDAQMQNPNIQMLAVRGNCDLSFSVPNSQLLTVNGVTIYACHGHEWHVKYELNTLCYAAREQGAQVVLYGHTHVSHLDMQNGLYMINPGTVCNFAADAVAYADIRVDDSGLIKADLIRWDS